MKIKNQLYQLHCNCTVYVNWTRRHAVTGSPALYCREHHAWLKWCARGEAHQIERLLLTQSPTQAQPTLQQAGLL